MTQVSDVPHSGFQFGRHQKFKLKILLYSLTPKMWGEALKSHFYLPQFKSYRQKYVQYGGHIEIKDGGHQGAFHSWVLIAK